MESTPNPLRALDPGYEKAVGPTKSSEESEDLGFRIYLPKLRKKRRPLHWPRNSHNNDPSQKEIYWSKRRNGSKTKPKSQNIQICPVVIDCSFKTRGQQNSFLSKWKSQNKQTDCRGKSQCSSAPPLRHGLFLRIYRRYAFRGKPIEQKSRLAEKRETQRS